MRRALAWAAAAWSVSAAVAWPHSAAVGLVLAVPAGFLWLLLGGTWLHWRLRGPGRRRR